MKKIVVALGGNAILQAGQRGTAPEQLANIQEACRHVADMIQAGYQVVLTHGNGPQVGNILIQNEAASQLVPALPLDVCGAETQGLIGYLLQQSLTNILRQQQLERPVVTVVTQVVVDSADPAFQSPTKPVGPFYSAETAARLAAEKGYVLREDRARGGWRRVVASPEPVRIQERDSIRQLIDAGAMVIAAGGGGVPVVETDGRLQGVEAVIDKDLASERLATDVGAEILLILTDIEAVAVNWGQPDQRFLEQVSVDQARVWQAEGHFQAGSMGPKVTAACRFVENGGEMSIIASLSSAMLALQGRSGTRFTR
jgi:carbamate kinase